MTDQFKKHNFVIKMKSYSLVLKDLINQIKEIEDDKFADDNVNISKILNIKEKIIKVGTEIDNAKKELTLVGYEIN